MKASLTRVTRRFLVVVLTLVFVWYIARAVKKLMKNQIGMAISQESRTQFSLPHVLVCMDLAQFKNFVLVGEAHLKVNSTEKGITSLDITPPEKIDGLIEEEENEEKWKWRTFYGLGDILCQEFMPARNWRFHFSQYNPILNFGLTVSNAKTDSVPVLYMVMTSPEEDAEVMALTEVSHKIAMPVFSTRKDDLVEIVKIALRMGQEVDLDTYSKPCQKPNEQDRVQSYSKCVWFFYETERGCGGATNRPCNYTTRTHIQYDIFNMAKLSRQEVFDRTGCLQSCQIDRYSVSISRGFKVPRDTRPPGFSASDLILEFSLPEPIFERREEFVVYDWGAFLADCAGLGGILLGISILAAFDLLCSFAHNIVAMHSKIKELSKEIGNK